MKPYHEINSEREAIQQKMVRSEHKFLFLTNFVGYYAYKTLLVIGALDG